MLTGLLGLPPINFNETFEITDPAVTSPEKYKQPTLNPEELQARLIPTTLQSKGFLDFGEYRNPDKLVKRYGIKIFKSMKQDDQIKPIMMLRKTAILAAPWTIQAASADPKDIEIAQFVEWCLTDGLHKISLGKIYENILSALDYGFSLNELVWYQVTEGEYKGKWALKNVKSIDPETITFKIDKYGELDPTQGIIHTGGYASGQQAFPPEKFLVYSYQKEFDNIYGISDLRSAYRSWYAKDVIIRFHSSFLEKHGNPILIIKHPIGIGPDLESKLDLFLKKLISSMGIRITNDVDVDFKSAAREAGNGSYYIEAINMHNKMIARSLHASDLQGFTETAYGQRALGETQQQPWLWGIDHTRTTTDNETINYQMIPRIVNYNFENVTRYPRFVRGELSKDDVTKLMSAYSVAKNLNAYQPTILSDVNTVREKIGLEPLEESDLIVENPLDPTPPDDNTPEDKDEETNDNSDSTDTNTDDDMEDDNQEGDAELSKKDQTFANNRVLTESEKRFNFTETVSVLDETEAEVARTVTTNYRSFKNYIIKKITEAFDNKGQDSHVNFLKLIVPGVTNMSRQVEDIYKDLYSYGMRSIRDEVSQVIEIPERFSVPEGYIPYSATEYLQQEADLVTRTTIDECIKTGQVVYKEAMEKGYDIDTIISNYDKMAIKDEKKLTTVGVRTAVTAIYNGGRMLEIQNIGPTLVPGYELSAIMDDRTTEDICVPLDGKTFRADSPDAWQFVPPFHFQCRTTLLAITITDTNRQAYIWVQDDPAEKAEVINIFENIIPVGFGGGSNPFSMAA